MYSYQAIHHEKQRNLVKKQRIQLLTSLMKIVRFKITVTKQTIKVMKTKITKKKIFLTCMCALEKAKKKRKKKYKFKRVVIVKEFRRILKR